MLSTLVQGIKFSHSEHLTTIYTLKYLQYQQYLHSFGSDSLLQGQCRHSRCLRIALHLHLLCCNASLYLLLRCSLGLQSCSPFTRTTQKQAEQIKVPTSHKKAATNQRKTHTQAHHPNTPTQTRKQANRQTAKQLDTKLYRYRSLWLNHGWGVWALPFVCTMVAAMSISIYIC